MGVTFQACEQTRHVLISWSVFVFSCHSPGALSDEAVCCGLMETGLILRLNDVSWLEADFISGVHPPTATLSWSHTAKAGFFDTPPNKNHHYHLSARILSLSVKLLFYLCNNNANLAPQAFWLGCWLKSAVDVCGLLNATLFFHYDRLRSDNSRWRNKENELWKLKCISFPHLLTCWHFLEHSNSGMHHYLS